MTRLLRKAARVAVCIAAAAACPSTASAEIIYPVVVTDSPADQPIDVLMTNDCGAGATCPTPTPTPTPEPTASPTPTPEPPGIVFDPQQLADPHGIGYAYAVADFNEDEHEDIAAHTSNGLAVYLGNGDGTLTPSFFAPANQNGNEIAVGDFNGDGKLDIAGVRTETLLVLAGDGRGGFTVAADAELHLPREAVGVTAADFNDDGRDDLAVAEAGDWPGVNGPFEGAYSIFYGDPSAGVQPGPRVTIPGARVFDIDWGDLNHDGTVDLVLATSDGLRVALGTETAAGEPSGAFASPVSYPQPASDARIGDLVRVDDLDNDGGLDDVVSIKADGDAITVRTADAAGTLSAPSPPITFTPSSTAQDAALGDFDADGNLDLAIADVRNDIAIAFGTGNGHFEDPGRAAFDALGNAMAVEAADLNGDSIDDLVVGDQYNTRWFYLRNAPFATFSTDLMDFGAVASGHASAARTVEVGNDGVAPLAVDGVTAVGDEGAFRVGPQNCAATTLAGGETCVMSAVFAPPAAGTYDGALELSSNDPEPLLDVELHGTGTGSTPPVPLPAPTPTPPTPGPAPPSLRLAPGPAATAAAATLSRALRRAGLDRLVKTKRLRVPVTIPAGTLTATITVKLKHGTRRSVAHGTARTAHDGPAQLTVAITRRSRKIIRRGLRRLEVTVTVRPTVGHTASSSRSVTVTRRPARVLRSLQVAGP